MVAKKHRVIMRLVVSPDGLAKLADIIDRCGMTEVTVTSRFIEWVCRQDDVTQAVILNLYPGHVDLPRRISEGMRDGGCA